MPQGDLALLLRLNKSWHDGISADDLYGITRLWWVMSPVNAQRVTRVLAVAGGIVREVYQPTRHGSANPVRYLPLDTLNEGPVSARGSAAEVPSATTHQVPDGTVEPGLLERILPLLDAFGSPRRWRP